MLFSSLYSKSNPGVVIYNAVIVILDLAFLLVKFWAITFREILISLKSEEKDVSREIVLITGAGHGIGKELALQYSALGSTIVCWDINEKLNQDTVKLIKENGGKAFGYT
jgi:all-trans-retinol dehydrogenase (NAD+)